MSGLILASGSPRRRQLLNELGAKFDVVVAAVTEREARDDDPRAQVAHNAALKADWVAERHPDNWVLGADTTVFIGNEVLNKPADQAEARKMLRRLSGQTHSVFTGMALRCLSAEVTQDQGVESRVTFRKLDEDIISRYLSLVNTLDKAGGYAIQEHGELVVENYTGSLSNIIGLPLDETKQLLTERGLLS